MFIRGRQGSYPLYAAPLFTPRAVAPAPAGQRRRSAPPGRATPPAFTSEAQANITIPATALPLPLMFPANGRYPL